MIFKVYFVAFVPQVRKPRIVASMAVVCELGSTGRGTEEAMMHEILLRGFGCDAHAALPNQTGYHGPSININTTG